MDRETEKACSPKQKAGSVVWPLIALLGIAVASWTVKTTFKQEQYRYHGFTSGDYHRIIQIDTKTNEFKVIYPKQKP